MSARADVIVLGAGMVGVSAALHLQRRGRDVVLIDRRDPGEETSYGNAGLIQREAVIPYTFPLKSSHSDQHLAPIRKSTSRKTARKSTRPSPFAQVSVSSGSIPAYSRLADFGVVLSCQTVGAAGDVWEPPSHHAGAASIGARRCHRWVGYACWVDDLILEVRATPASVIPPTPSVMRDPRTV